MSVAVAPASVCVTMASVAGVGGELSSRRAGLPLSTCQATLLSLLHVSRWAAAVAVAVAVTVAAAASAIGVGDGGIGVCVRDDGIGVGVGGELPSRRAVLLSFANRDDRCMSVEKRRQHWPQWLRCRCRRG